MLQIILQVELKRQMKWPRYSTYKRLNTQKVGLLLDKFSVQLMHA